MKRKPIAIDIQNKGDKTADILIYDVIGAGWLGGISALDFAKELKELGTLDQINVRINSEGGSVFDGVAIYNSLVKNGARVIVDIDGLAASIASIIAMAGDELRMASNAMFMIHNPWIVAAGSADELREQADLLDKVRGQLIETYVARSDAEAEVVGQLMDAETWMTAEEAFKHGFIDEITEEVKIAAHVHNDMMRFKHPPEALLATADGSKIGDTDHEPVASDSLQEIRARLKAHKL